MQQVVNSDTASGQLRLHMQWLAIVGSALATCLLPLRAQPCSCAFIMHHNVIHMQVHANAVSLLLWQCPNMSRQEISCTLTLTVCCACSWCKTQIASCETKWWR